MSCSDRRLISASSTEFVRARVNRWLGATASPSAFPVSFGFSLSETSEPQTWFEGDWETVGAKTFARVLVGPEDGVDLSQGVYATWVKVDAGPEHLVRMIGPLEIT